MGEHSISRRSFIKGAAAGALSMVTLGLLQACESNGTPANAAANAVPSVAPSAGGGEAVSAGGNKLYTPGTYTGKSQGIGEITATRLSREGETPETQLGRRLYLPGAPVKPPASAVGI